MEREAALRDAQQRSLDAEPPCNGGSVSKECEFCRRSKAVEISEIPVGNLRASAPTPAAIHDRAHFGSGCNAAHVQVRQRCARSNKSPRQIPIFVPSIGVKAQAQTGITVERHGNRQREAAFFRIPANERGHIRSEEHTSELQSHLNLVCRLLLENKKNSTRIDLTLRVNS